MDKTASALALLFVACLTVGGLTQPPPEYTPASNLNPSQTETPLLEFDKMTVVSTELINYYNFNSSYITQWVNVCVAQGLTEVTLRIPAYSDFIDGELSESGYWQTLAVVAALKAAGIDSNIDVHTWYTTWDTYFRDSATGSSSYRTAYKNYLTDVINSFDGVSGVKAFMVLNEPQARTASASENTFIIECINLAQSLTSLPVSVRFMAGYSPSTGHYSSAIDLETDFLARNTYWDPRYPATSVYGTTETKMNTDIALATSLGKELWITEFGKVKTNLTEQKNYVEAFVAYAKAQEIDRIFAWASSPTDSSESYNLLSGFTPNPAWYELDSDAPASSDVNYAPIFQTGTAVTDCSWGDYDGTLVYFGNHGDDQIVFRDDTVTRSGHSSIRMEAPNEYNLNREINHLWRSVKPGDTVTFGCYIKTAAGTGNAGIIGFDVYGPTHRLLEIHPCTPQTAIWNIVNEVPTQGGTTTYVPYGSDWTLLEFTVTIPSTVYTKNDFGKTLYLSSDGRAITEWEAGAVAAPQQIAGLIPWLGAVWNGRESYPDVWYADAYFYINPTDDPPDTITITASSDGHCALSSEGAVSVVYGGSKTFTWTLDAGYIIDTITVDSVAVGNTGSYTFLNCVANHTIAITSIAGGAVFQDEFESGNLTAWTGNFVTSGEAIAASTTQKKTGAYSAVCTTNGGGGTENAYVYYTLSPAQSEVYARCYVYVDTNGIADNGDFLDFIRVRVDTTLLAHFGIRQTSGNIRWWSQCRDGTGYVDTYAASSPSTGQWYCVEGHWKSHATEGGVELFINGVSVLSTWVRDTDNYGAANRVAMGIAETSGVAASTVYIDACVIAASAIGVLNRKPVFAVLRLMNGE